MLRSLAARLASGELDPVAHVQEVLERLAADPFNAVVALDADRALAEAARPRPGPLSGVPVGVKDLIDVAGLPTRCGSAVLADAPPAAADAPVVAKLRAAGAIVVAKLHTHEFAYGPTGDVAATGPARNPHDPTRITGGSSSGSAAAVAAGYLPLALGTDTGASVRTPAALCGVVGLKPRFGALPTDGVFPLSESCDHVGLLTPDVDSAAFAWEVFSGERPVPLGRLRVGVPVDEYWWAYDPVLEDAAAIAVAQLRDDGAQVVRLRTPMIEELAATYTTIVGSEAYATHRRWLAAHPDDYQPATRARLAPFADLKATSYIAAQRARRRLVAELARACADVDVLVLPTTQLRATPIGAEVVDGHVVGTSLLALTLPFNLAGWPAVSVPGPVSDGGLPAGVQVVGVRVDEHAVLQVAARITAR
ncbi:aspartyl-tRNA(Asn)/glutamyl-tRNA(Gln) amidotransferase subunit A [Pseudonocardia thermophila]|uniref:Aspartyl-tRNA(Asn)/glutamyl-tRNA(Gln) amidotransferase subunit A n=1 Tax=Pseudonocardia thermophila TaxID=1848 RepID=A0A1M6SIL4_PSETH|nr:amidase [Pseudonocardia thermophila]SHK44466.1 aspartyl-tRNA(Asn)/glutamyl-tRNA(Gln) amidotransferase subunit A [Pseudonocardia thermophila]